MTRSPQLGVKRFISIKEVLSLLKDLVDQSHAPSKPTIGGNKRSPYCDDLFNRAARQSQSDACGDSLCCVHPITIVAYPGINGCEPCCLLRVPDTHNTKGNSSHCRAIIVV